MLTGISPRSNDFALTLLYAWSSETATMTWRRTAMRPDVEFVLVDCAHSGPSRAERGKRDWQPAKEKSPRARAIGWF